MTTRTRTAQRTVDPPASSETQATITLVLLVLAGLIVFMLPHYFTFQLGPLPTLVLGDWVQKETIVEPWQIGDFGQLRHLRYAEGGTCTQAIAGPITLQACR